MGLGLDLLRAEYGGPLYQKALQLREKELCKPLGLEFDSAFTGDDQSAALHLCLLLQGTAVGTAMLVEVGNHEVKMRQVAVEASLRGFGLGGRMIRYIEGFAAARGYRAIHVPARKTAEAFYHKMGYTTITGSDYTEVGIPHAMMIKEI